VKGEMKMIYCCEEHVEQALDMVVDEFKTFPLLTKIDGDNLSTGCEYCRNTATYIVANE
jgi:CxxH/CxxC protein (TIGR04129 family)